MRKRILLIILCFSICTSQGFAAMMNFYHNPNELAIATGTVQAMGLNSIDIYDEDRKRVERFIYLQSDGQFRKGDDIRIYYHPKTAIVVTIKRMTVLEYRSNNQNLGNIFHQ
jgi:hypothetical protein